MAAVGGSWDVLEGIWEALRIARGEEERRERIGEVARSGEAGSQQAAGNAFKRF